MLQGRHIRRYTGLLALLLLALSSCVYHARISSWLLPNAASTNQYLSHKLLNVSSAYVLTGDPARAHSMTKMLTYAGIAHQVVKGPDPYSSWMNATAADEAVSAQFDANWNIHKYPDYFRRTMACTLGHRAIYQDALKYRYERILILEDDVDIRSDIFATMQQVWQQLPSDWGILMLGYAIQNAEKQWQHPDSTELVQPMNYGLQSHAYIVNGRYVEDLLEASADVTLAPVDTLVMKALPTLGMLKLYGIKPAIALQMDSVPSLLSGSKSTWGGRGDFGRDGLAFQSSAWV